MLCIKCETQTQKSTTTYVDDLRNCHTIVRNVPCYKCLECSEVTFTGDVVEKLEEIVETAKKFMQEISVTDYAKVA